jgi:hypothetical protein
MRPTDPISYEQLVNALKALVVDVFDAAGLQAQGMSDAEVRAGMAGALSLVASLPDKLGLKVGVLEWALAVGIPQAMAAAFAAAMEADDDDAPN